MNLARAVLIPFAVVLAVATVYTIWRDENPPDRPALVRIGYQKTILYLPVFVAKERKFFEDRQIEATLIPYENAQNMMDALMAGEIDATGMSPLEIIAGIEQESPGALKMYIFEAFDPEASPDYIIARPASRVKTLRDLRGRRLGVRPGTTIEMYSRIILRKFGLDPEAGDIELIKLDETRQKQALESGQVDAVFTFETEATALLDSKVGEQVEYAVLARYLMDSPTTIYPGAGVFSSKFVNEAPGTARKTIDAIYAAVEHIATNRDDAVVFLTDYLPVDQPTARRVRLVRWVQPRNMDRKEVQKLITLYHENKILRKPVDLQNAYLKAGDLQSARAR